VRGFDDELDGADFVEGGYGAAGNDGERGREGSDGNKAEVGACGEEFVGALRGLGVVQRVTSSEVGGQRWVLEVPHEGSGIEEVDGGDTEHSRWDPKTSLVDVVRRVRCRGRW